MFLQPGCQFRMRALTELALVQATFSIFPGAGAATGYGDLKTAQAVRSENVPMEDWPGPPQLRPMALGCAFHTEKRVTRA